MDTKGFWKKVCVHGQEFLGNGKETFSGLKIDFLKIFKNLYNFLIFITFLREFNIY